MADRRAAREREAEPEVEGAPSAERRVEEGPKSFWSGTISFGLVSVPVALYSATRGAPGSSLRMLAPDGAPLRREYLCPEHERALEPDEIVRAYELDDGERVVITDAELEALAPEASRDIEIQQFVDRDQLSPLMFERPYFLLPSTTTIKPYRLLALVLEQLGRAGIATFVMRGHEHVVAILAEGGLLRAQTLRFVSELRTPEQIGLPEAPAKIPASKLERMRKLIREHTEADIDPRELDDETRDRTRALAERKLAEGRDVVEQPEAEPGAEAEIIDLMEVLKQSLGRPPSSPPPPAPPSRVSAEASKQELYEQAQALEIEGRSAMSKQELREAIERATRAG
ncbi:MAG: Ku protein [Enhygromyxa sp.]